MSAPEARAPETPAAPTDDIQLSGLTRLLWQVAGETTGHLSESCLQLHTQIEDLLDAPSQTQLQQAQNLWQQLHARVLLTNPVTGLAATNPSLFAELAQDLTLVTQQPIAPGFLDRVQNYPYSGIVYDVSLPLNRDTLLNQHGLTAANEATVGLHVLEFLLFGDTGERSVDDFRQANVAGSHSKSSEQPNNRRRTLLQLTSRLTCDALESLPEHWHPGSTSAHTYNRLASHTQLELWRYALASNLQTILDPEHCEFTQQPCIVSPDAVGSLLSFLAHEHDGYRLLPELNLLSLDAQLESLQNNAEVAAAERQQHLTMILKTISEQAQTPGQK
ncbi:imelysin family protein [Gilvimarinus sp. SDUM040013]|uniref:Imelysin family protein n=1 Tax=Gilvimarinus gilvus TaxID=3058038 RepID=A0ABU4S222_9GAMM|nr:imelysin family protein [Gilvimarinus sp. SDUM040013]MDO3387426.1 imelysin family protein [Gilvimarinus sp. SDUM040013]MDX6849903.1 imelysin family protein [Gilvimarinus sp. SDUM040013]